MQELQNQKQLCLGVKDEAELLEIQAAARQKGTCQNFHVQKQRVAESVMAELPILCR